MMNFCLIPVTTADKYCVVFLSRYVSVSFEPPVIDFETNVCFSES
jgi:hypothetical protein